MRFQNKTYEDIRLRQRVYALNSRSARFRTANFLRRRLWEIDEDLLTHDMLMT
ncbi:hypothetical protein SAMN05216386_1468 [Nitrosospira briensis]|uniref:Uncharacterized protein n=1 Tax=Nitrosospira briensis TaxID=35799 RepID=A0A1I5ANI9_9PROT|nr:hypothetical protein SAMN05216386_1468 [Nitrosospira briensis]